MSSLRGAIHPKAQFNQRHEFKSITQNCSECNRPILLAKALNIRANNNITTTTAMTRIEVVVVGRDTTAQSKRRIPSRNRICGPQAAIPSPTTCSLCVNGRKRSYSGSCGSLTRSRDRATGPQCHMNQ